MSYNKTLSFESELAAYSGQNPSFTINYSIKLIKSLIILTHIEIIDIFRNISISYTLSLIQLQINTFIILITINNFTIIPISKHLLHSLTKFPHKLAYHKFLCLFINQFLRLPINLLFFLLQFNFSFESFFV